MDIVRVQVVGLSGADDPTILAWAAQEQRVLLTHDVTTVTHYAYERTGRGEHMPGVVEVTRDLAIGLAIEDIVLIAECSVDGEYEGRIIYLPL